MTAASPTALPRSVVVLGVLATIPFVAGAVSVWFVDGAARLAASQALSAYAAIVVAFIGAIHWGLAFRLPAPRTSLFVWGVVPSIVAWLAALAPPRAGLAAHAAMLVACWLVDRVVYPRGRRALAAAAHAADDRRGRGVCRRRARRLTTPARAGRQASVPVTFSSSAHASAPYLPFHSA